MESNKNLTEQNQSSTKRSTTAGQPQGGSSGQTTASATQKAREVASEVSGGAQAVYEQTVKAVGDAYEKTSEVLGKTYDQTVSYGRENPGKLTLIAFGAGIGIGMLLASGFGGRNRTRRYAEPVVDALSRVALEFFR